MGFPVSALCSPGAGIGAKAGGASPAKTSPRLGSVLWIEAVTGSPTLLPPARIMEFKNC